jgi:serine-type D-Ala-D-Ala carboxypeptidase (penicillin-binding protein 5/6)
MSITARAYAIIPSLALGLALMLSALTAFAGPAQAGYAHFVVDAATGKVLAAENADTLNHPASLTKMMTLYMVFEALRDGRLKWDQQIVMSRNGAATIPTKLGVPAGKTYTVREAVYGMVVKSANDAAEGIGDHLYGSEEKFGEAMTRKARQLGMSRTVFRNGSGLPDSRQVTTARDMATLGLALMRDYPREYKIFATRSFTFRGKTIRGHNNLMYRYNGMDGIKTGFINASGFNIVSAVNDKGRRVIGVVMGGRTARARDAQMAALLDDAMPRASVRGGALVAAVGAPNLPRSGVPTPFRRAPAEPDGLDPVAAQIAHAETIGRTQSGENLGISADAADHFPPVPDRPSAERPARKRTHASRTAPLEPVASPSIQAFAYAEGPVPQAPIPGRPGSPPGGLPFAMASHTGWTVQLAAAPSQAEAISLLSRALPALDRSFSGITPYTESVQGRSGLLHRARLSGFENRAAAQSACRALTAQSFSCLVVNGNG